MRYFFNLHECGRIILDPDGIEHPDVQSAELAAIDAARDIMAGEVRGGQLCLGCHIEVFDCEGRQVLRLPFRDAVGVTGL